MTRRNVALWVTLEDIRRHFGIRKDKRIRMWRPQPFDFELQIEYPRSARDRLMKLLNLRPNNMPSLAFRARRWFYIGLRHLLLSCCRTERCGWCVEVRHRASFCEEHMTLHPGPEECGIALDTLPTFLPLMGCRTSAASVYGAILQANARYRALMHRISASVVGMAIIPRQELQKEWRCQHLGQGVFFRWEAQA